MAKTMNWMTALAALTWAGYALADHTCFTADQNSGELGFSGVAEGTPFRGYFGQFHVRLCLHGDDLSTAEIEVAVQTGSADVGNRDGNQALKDGEFFAVDRFPEATWKSGEVEIDGDEFLAEGELSIKEVSASQPVRLSLDTESEPWTLSGGVEIMRLDWEVGVGEFEDPDFIRNRVDLRFELELEPDGES